MYTSKFKLALHWLLITIGFYLFWCLSYLILAKFALSQFSRFNSSTGKIWSEITASDIFWYALFIFGIAIAIFVIRKLIEYSPNPKIAAIIYATLIIVSVGVLVDKLLETTALFNVIPHVVINLAFLIAIAVAFFKKARIADSEDDQEDPESTF
ncbi:hypothetical protein [Pedobacter nyackensis]|uniref:hypothetical protein n=1 Tax=Pedobacter nyackensis TaxID=475255 RepID=UPI00292E7F39|nr:hypothetical protein [Pedobacter nyackensis]